VNIQNSLNNTSAAAASLAESPELNSNLNLCSNNNNNINSNTSHQFSSEYNEEKEKCMQIFDNWLPAEQTEFIETVLKRF
jgi:hypothetical protein